jgi:hypothetical protein
MNSRFSCIYLPFFVRIDDSGQDIFGPQLKIVGSPKVCTENNNSKNMDHGHQANCIFLYVESAPDLANDLNIDINSLYYTSVIMLVSALPNEENPTEGVKGWADDCVLICWRWQRGKKRKTWRRTSNQPES